MAGSSYGTIFRISTWGESHGKALGVVIDGCPAGVPLSSEDIQINLNKRKPGQSVYATPRKEADRVQILSGTFQGKTTGTPISLLVYNENQRSKDYSQIANYYRPGHADMTYDLKYGFRDYRGGGRSSGRETIGRVAAGSIAKKILKSLGVEITTYTKSIGKIQIDPSQYDPSLIWNNPLCMPDEEARIAAEAYLTKLLEEGNSSGGVIECIVEHLPAGLGEPVFDRLDAELAKGVMSIGSVKGVEIGNGFEASTLTGHENNDFYHYDHQGLSKQSNHAGGVYGGISDGSTLTLRAAIKPTPSIHATQQTVNKMGENIDVNIQGRHDPIIVPRAVIVVESMVAVTLLDMLLRNMSSQMEHLHKLYPRENNN